MKNAKLWLIHVFCKILESYPISVKFWIVYSVSMYVMTKSCKKTQFCMIYVVWQFFPRFLVVSVINRQLEMELGVF